MVWELNAALLKFLSGLPFVDAAVAAAAAVVIVAVFAVVLDAESW